MKKLLFLSIFSWMFAATCAFAATTYYVSNSGSDSNNGTSTATPWQTLARIKTYCANAVPGDSILLKKGNVWHEQLDLFNQVNSASGWTTTSNPPLCSGSSSGQLTIGSYGTGANPIIDAADPITLTCSVFNAATYSCTTTSAIPTKLYVDSATTEAPQLLPMPNALGDYNATTTYYPYDAVVNKSLLYIRGPLPASSGVAFTTTYAWVMATNHAVGNTQPVFSLTNTGPQNVEATPGSWYADIAGRYGAANTIYIHLADGSNPRGHTFEGTQRRYGISLQGVNYVTISGVTAIHAQQSCISLNAYPLDRGTYFTNEYNIITGVSVFNCGGIVFDHQPLQALFIAATGGIVVTPSATTNPHLLRGDLIKNFYVGTVDSYLGYNGTGGGSAGIIMNGIDGGGASENIVISNGTVSTVNTEAISYATFNAPSVNRIFLNNGGRITGVTAKNNQGNIFFMETAGGQADHNTIYNSYGEGFQLGGSSTSTSALPQLITLNNIYNLGYSASLGLFNGIDCNSLHSNADGIYVTYNHVTNTASSSITNEQTKGFGCTGMHVWNNTFSQKGLLWPGNSHPNSGKLYYWNTGAGDVNPDFKQNTWIPGSNVTNEFYSTSTVNFNCTTFFKAWQDVGSACTTVDPVESKVPEGHKASH